NGIWTDVLLPKVHRWNDLLRKVGGTFRGMLNSPRRWGLHFRSDHRTNGDFIVALFQPNNVIIMQ
ncbi:MAG: hypothetical protein AB8I58_09470, partial [Anaerolineales bacterium]